MGDWKPTKIRRIIETLESSTGASLVMTDEGKAYAKFMGNPEGPQSLFCEALGTMTAEYLGLPIFEHAFVNVTEPGLVEYADGSKSSTGPAFVAREQEGTTWGGTEEELEAVVNPQVCAGLVVLDTWIRNCDRYRPDERETRCNYRNVFLSGTDAPRGKFRLVAMDHTHCLVCGWELTAKIGHIDSTKDGRLYGHFPAFRKYITEDAVRTYATRLSAFRSSDAQQFLGQMPSLWQVQAPVKSAVVEFLSQRALFVAENIHQMLADEGFLEPELPLKDG